MEAEYVTNTESCLECSICYSVFVQATNIAECGHRFCLKCIQTSLKESSVCPTCQKPADIKHLTADPRLDNVLGFIDTMKNAILSHPLTPLSLSLRQQQQQHMSQRAQNMNTTSNSDETSEMYQLEETSSDLIPSAEEIEQSFSRKRKHTGADTQNTDTQTTLNEEEDLEREFNDSVSAPTTQDAKRFKPFESGTVSQNLLSTEDVDMTEKKPKITDDNEKKRLLNPKNILGDIWSFSQDDIDAAQSQSQQNESSAMASVSGNSESEATQKGQQSASEDHALTDEPTSQATQSAAITEASKDFIPDTVYSDSEDDAGKQDELQGQYYASSRRSRCQYSSPSSSPKTTAKEPYKMTVAGDEENAPAEGTFTVPKTRRRTNSVSRKEVHIMYTGLTPEDEKKLDKIKEEADLTLKIVIHYQMRDFNDVTHVITSVDKKHLCKRTLKYLQGVLKGKWVVDPQWLIDSTKSKKWQAEDKYEVQGDHLTGKTHAPKLARESQQEPLFQDMKLYLFGDFTGKHNKNDLLILCKAGGAKILSRKPPGHVARSKQALDLAEPIVIYSADQKKRSQSG
ncbi:unnamed protein product [Mucor circinelloides]